LKIASFLPWAFRPRAKDNYEIQVYGSDLVEPGHTTFELVALTKSKPPNKLPVLC
jgi:hypothetical protein